MRAWIMNILARIGRPHSESPYVAPSIGAELQRVDRHIQDKDRHLTRLEREKAQIEARLRLLEMQGTPRGKRDDG